ncbi:M56 family metallopeptidase [Flavobacterium macacae]|uniref:Regulatory sensor-transducer, BlaR1/MecR1 family protein n=1 Tax=Flavobacterium macacae TaxID=2488993 RepID=A0A3P3WGY4_9FLAO|nr:M56 family metallopeptidase [Flavobacterium macacae]RRJ93798.1 regulatory sensor-transducer, BlaR1/MecR1 family protein [Flavobacterium macacae]
MIAILIKSTLCLFLLLGVYKLFLEKEKMSRFNRFYLLGSIVFSFVIPFLKFDFAIETFQNAIIPNAIQVVQGETITITNETSIWPALFWIFHGIITSLFLFRFGKNLFEIISKIRTNPKEKYQNAILVLIEEKILPHTFLNYIFINKSDFENRNIEDELYMHELTHVRQRHTLDVLFIEFLKTLFWFNPILIFYKKAIQLNHEFLADEKVVTSYNNVPFYQSLLLEKASWNSNFYLASNLNFLVTKKRLIMMTKTTSQSRALLKKLAVVPVLAGLIFISCSKNLYDAKTSQNKNAIVKKLEPINGNPNSKKLKESDIYTSIEVIPEFPGGMSAFGQYVLKEFKIPSELTQSGNVLASFVVETDGSLTNINIIRDLGHGTKEETLRILKNSPKWLPGQENGKLVRAAYNLPIRLKVEKK